MTLSEKIDNYFDLEGEIHKEFGYEETWKVYPIDDGRSYVWYMNEREVAFADEKFHFATGKGYSNSIIGYGYQIKNIWKTDDLTMILVDTHSDGNKFLQIFDNKKEITFEDLNEIGDFE